MADELDVPGAAAIEDPVEGEHCDPYTPLKQRWEEGGRRYKGSAFVPFFKIQTSGDLLSPCA